MIHILYTDDEPDFVEIVTFFLEQSGEFLVHPCSSAADALIKLSTCHFDAIVSDYHMPGIHGIDFLKRIWAEYLAITGITITETSVSSRGVRFKILVQSGKWRSV